MRINQLKEKVIAIFLASVLLGYLVMLQLNLNIKIDDITDPKKTNTISMEVAQLIKGNQKLREELSLLQTDKEKLANVYSSESIDSVKKEVEKYKIITGKTEVVGSGVIITFDKRVEKIQLVDLLNALRNIGQEAISINNQRVVINSYITEKMLKPPIEIKVIGNPEILYDSLLRRGGIMQQIGASGTIIKKDKIIIRSI